MPSTKSDEYRKGFDDAIRLVFETLTTSSLAKINYYYKRTRGIGHTRAALEGVKNIPNAIFGVADHNQLRGLELSHVGLDKKKGIVVTHLSPNAYVLNNIYAPLVIDHYALMKLLDELLESIRYNSAQRKQSWEPQEQECNCDLCQCFGHHNMGPNFDPGEI